MARSEPGHMDGGLDGQRVLVTAGAGGIGLAIAERLLRLGARLVVCDVSDAALASFKEAHPAATAVRADVSADDDVDRMFEAVRDGLGGLDGRVRGATSSTSIDITLTCGDGVPPRGFEPPTQGLGNPCSIP